MTRKQLETAAVPPPYCRPPVERLLREARRRHRAVRVFDLARRSALIRKLSVLVVIGDTDGHRPIGDDEPWLRDDAAEANKPHDSETAAKINWRAAGASRPGGREGEPMTTSPALFSSRLTTGQPTRRFSTR